MVKTFRFKKPHYLGDPVNIVRLFNDKEVDEILILDIGVRRKKREPDFPLIAQLASECFMPVTYGGGISSIDQVARLFRLGVEKVCLNTAAFQTPGLISAASQKFGAQSIVASLDVRDTWWRGPTVYVDSGKKGTGMHPVEAALLMERAGAGELLIHSIDRDGTRIGYDLDMIQEVSQSVEVPVIACGGAGDYSDLPKPILMAGASAAAAGSLFVYHGRHHAVLVNYPEESKLLEMFKRGD